MDKIQNIHEFLNKEEFKTVSGFFDGLKLFFNHKKIYTLDSITSDLIDEDLITEIKRLPGDVTVSFGKTLRDLKCTISEQHSSREHDIYLKYKGFKKLIVVAVGLPHSQLQDHEYSCIEEVASAFKNYVTSLSAYFYELENIDRYCIVKEPVKPTFKDDYRRILVDNKTWLHIEVTSDGLARNVHIIGNSEQQQEKMKNCLFSWDHDKNIVENINSLFDVKNDSMSCEHELVNDMEIDELPSCCICFCVELPDCPGIPQPLCQNSNCEAYYHRSCLFQWLVACDGGRMPAFGVANGSCPTCLQPTTCNEKDTY